MSFNVIDIISLFTTQACFEQAESGTRRTSAVGLNPRFDRPIRICGLAHPRRCRLMSDAVGRTAALSPGWPADRTACRTPHGCRPLQWPPAATGIVVRAPRKLRPFLPFDLIAGVCLGVHSIRDLATRPPSEAVEFPSTDRPPPNGHVEVRPGPWHQRGAWTRFLGSWSPRSRVPVRSGVPRNQPLTKGVEPVPAGQRTGLPDSRRAGPFSLTLGCARKCNGNV